MEEPIRTRTETRVPSGTRVRSGKGGTRRGLSAVLVLMVLIAITAWLAAPPGLFAGHLPPFVFGSFEIEGNLIDNSGPGEPIDWETAPGTTGFSLVEFTDDTGNTDDIFGQGSKELEPGGWTCIPDQSAPAKDDVLRGAIGFRVLDGKQYLYVDFIRASPNGNAHMDYEFNQSQEPNPACPETASRTDGDILITFDTEGGGQEILVRAFLWQGTATVGTFVELPLGARGVIWDGAVNIPDDGSTGLEAGEFGEAALNLTDSPIGNIECEEFASTFMKTRASTSITAELKDRTPLAGAPGPCPELTLRKDADKTTVQPGETITYTLTYSNIGNVEATGTVINEQVPENTEFVSCTGDCTTSGDPISDVSWPIGTVPAGGEGSVTLTVRVLETTGCLICNVATIDSDQTDPLDSNEVCVIAVPGPRPSLANAFGSAFGIWVKETTLSLDQKLALVRSSQSGVGSDSANTQILDANVPSPGGEILQADVLRTSSTSTVTQEPAQARQTSVAEAVNLNVLGGLVTASNVRGVANTTATGSWASFSSTGSTFKDLAVAGNAVNTVNPGDRVDLPEALYGSGSYVALFERNGSTTTPAPGQLSGGTYAADLTVNMIRVHVTDWLPLVAGDQTLDLVVSGAEAHSDFPQITLCQPPPKQSVSGHAFIGSETTSPSVFPALVGYVSIPATGGHDHQDHDVAMVPSDGSAVTSRSARSDSSGSLGAASSTASSYAEAESVCVLQGANGCAVAATVLRSQSNSAADAQGAAADDGGTAWLGASVSGVSVSAAPEPNTVIEIPGIGFVILNEQFCDNSASLAAGCSDGTGHAGLTVRAIHVVVTVPGNPTGLTPGAEIIVAEAHSDAFFSA